MTVHYANVIAITLTYLAEREYYRLVDESGFTVTLISLSSGILDQSEGSTTYYKVKRFCAISNYTLLFEREKLSVWINYRRTVLRFILRQLSTQTLRYIQIAFKG